MKHCMIDLETLGTSPDSVFLSVAAVQFDLLTGEIGNIFYEHVQMSSSLQFDRKVNAATVEWWMKQSDEAREAMFSDKAMDIVRLLTLLSNFIKDNSLQTMWCNGGSFDFPMLTHAYKYFGIQTPWNFRYERDLRTIKNLYMDLGSGAICPSQTVPDTGTTHNAKDDCLYQIGVLSAIMKELKTFI